MDYQPSREYRPDKLIRDNIPKILEDKNIYFEIESVKPEDRKMVYYKKVVEETEELRQAVYYQTNKEAVEELADVVTATLAMTGMTFEDLKKAYEDKLKEKGGFELGIILKYLET